MTDLWRNSLLRRRRWRNFRYRDAEFARCNMEPHNAMAFTMTKLLRDPAFRKAAGQHLSRDPMDPDFRAALYPFAYITRVSSRYNADLTRNLRKVGLDQPSWRILMILVEQGIATVSELVERTAVKQPTLTRILQRMRRNDLVQMAARPEDLRVYEATITPLGLAAVERARPLASAAFRRGTAGFSDEEIGFLIELLTRLENNYKR